MQAGMMRPKLSDLAKAAKKIKLDGPQTARRKTQYRILEAPACRRVALVGKDGCVNGRAAESLQWKLRAWENNYLILAVLLQGKSKGVFSAGWERGDTAEESIYNFTRYTQLAYMLATCSKPTIAHYNGEVIGGGLGLGLARYRVATPSSSFQVTGAKTGWILDGGLSYVLPRLRTTAATNANGTIAATSMGLARYLALTGAPLSGEDMIASGLATHYTTDSLADLIPNSLSGLSYEPDHMVEDVMTEHSEVFYKLDAKLNPPHYREIWSEWEKNDKAKQRVMNGGSVLPSVVPDRDEQGGWINPDDEEDGEVDERARTEKEEAEEYMQEIDVEDELVESADMKAQLAREGLLDEEDVSISGAAGGNKKRASARYASETEGSLWWHRNFAKGDEALYQAQMEIAESRMKMDPNFDELAEIIMHDKFGEGHFPEYINYPERTRLVNADMLLLSPWNCTVDRSETFPDYLNLMEKIEKCFKGDSVEEVVDGLRSDNSAWAQECLRRMEGMSPLSLKVMFKQLNESVDIEIEDCFQLDYRVGHRMLLSPSSSSSVEGSNALSLLSEVVADQVDELFEPLSDRPVLKLPERTSGNARVRDREVDARFYKTSSSKPRSR